MSGAQFSRHSLKLQNRREKQRSWILPKMNSLQWQKRLTNTWATHCRTTLSVHWTGGDTMPHNFCSSLNWQRSSRLPARSVYSDCSPSMQYGHIFEEKLARLLPTTGEKLLFLHHKWKIGIRLFSLYSFLWPNFYFSDDYWLVLVFDIYCIELNWLS